MTNSAKNQSLEELAANISKTWTDNIAGYILSDLEQNVLVCNNAAKAHLNLTTDKDFNVLDVFNISQDYINNVLNTKENNSLNGNSDTANCYKMMNIIQEIVQKDKTPVQFVGFWPYNGEYKSLLFHCLPIFNAVGEVIALSYIFSEYSMWGIQEYLDINEKKPSNFLTVIPKDFKFAIQLTQRQHEVLFLLLSGISQRMSAQILGISYGTLSRFIREYICIKFGIEDGNIELLITKALKMGYSKYIPQSLCRPCIIILNPDLIVRYFSYDKKCETVKNVKKIRN